MTDVTILFGTNSVWWRIRLAWTVLFCDAGIRICDVEVEALARDPESNGGG